MEELAAFGKPPPILVVTGGDALLRGDLFEIIESARELGLPVAVAPSVTPLLTAEKMTRLRDLGVKAVSISLDGSTSETHDGIRGIDGHFDETLSALRLISELGFKLQVNTCIMRDNVDELPEIGRIVGDVGAAIWELFFLIPVGRGAELQQLSPEENEDVCHFLFEASRYGFIVRTVEGPFFRRVVQWRADEPLGTAPEDRFDLGPLYRRLSGRLKEMLGDPSGRARAQTKGTRDGKGIVFVASNGDIFPAGFLPLQLGNVRRESIVHVYQSHPVMRQIRAAQFLGRCGRCKYADLCGGSRARAFACSGNPLEEDPACGYSPP